MVRLKRMRSVALAAGVLALGVAGAARADWNIGQPAKWVQLPDLQFGMDVYDTALLPGATPQPPVAPYSKILADDWLCTSVDPVTDIHIWGSWLNNVLPTRQTPQGPIFDPGFVTFKLSIHEDVPVGPTNPYSHPGVQVWSAVMPATAVRPWATANEVFYDPNINQIIGTDTQVWQYNFTNLPSPFIQQGTTAIPKVYWLDMQALVGDGTGTDHALFGWKTAEPLLQPPFHRLDDAVFADTQGFNGPLLPNGNAANPVPWTDMHYLPNYPSPGHPLNGQSFDLAFVITSPEPGTLTALALGGMMLLARRRR